MPKKPRMTGSARKVDPLPTIWETPDPLWQKIEPILNPLDPSAPTGRPRSPPRRSLDGILYQMRSGTQWIRLPRQFGSDSAAHRTFQRWVKLGLLQRETNGDILIYPSQ